MLKLHLYSGGLFELLKISAPHSGQSSQLFVEASDLEITLTPFSTEEYTAAVLMGIDVT